MSYSKGLIPKEQVKDLVEFLKAIGIPVRVASAAWEMYQVQLVGRWWAITCSSKDVVGIPDAMLGLTQKFLRETTNFDPSAITDTQRLDFMLSEHRKVVIEIEGRGSLGRHYAVYVEEGFMGDRQYAPVKFTQAEEFSGSSPQGAEIKRQAIDLAINESKEQTNEKSN